MYTPTPDQNCRISYSLEQNSVCVDLAEFDPEKVLVTIEAVCMAIADACPDENPYGLFWHPQTNEETTLVLCKDTMLYQDAASLLIEEMYKSCNNPAHIVLHTSATLPVQNNLSEIIATHLKPRHLGGYVAEDRPKATWVWLCHGEIASIAPDVLESMGKAGGNIRTAQFREG